MFWGEDVSDNHWWQASQLVRTGKGPKTCLTGEVLSITGSAADTESLRRCG